MKWLLAMIPFSLFADAPSSQTVEMNRAVLTELPFQNRQDFQDAERGFIAPLPDGGVIKNEKGEVIWDLQRYQFLKGNPPGSANPSLWRQAQLLARAGLFKVIDGIYQIRGADISNMTIIEGKKGIIVIDPLISIECAQVALDLYFAHRPKKKVTALLYTHSHLDHFGGALGVVSEADVRKKRVRVIAPEGFTQASLDENVMAGTAMGRRATYMYGTLLSPGPEGQMSSGLGLTASTGTTSLVLPTEVVSKTGQEMVIDGVKFIFLMAPHSEAPAEMLFYLPDLKALCAAEDACHTMHNIYTLRGAKIRDAYAWAHYLTEAIEMFGKRSEVVFEQHHWPVWGQERVVDFLEKQRDMYKYLHDQVLRLANQGYTMLEIGERVKLPKTLSDEWYNRGYYGTVSHNAKSIYCFYLGWFDGNPSTLHQLPPVAAGEKYVEYMGGADAVIERAKGDYAAGNYRWTAQVLNHVVFADPANQKARELLAKTLEQLGYQSENGTWRNFYLTGAQELRHGVEKNAQEVVASPEMIAAMPTDSLFDYLSIRLDGQRAADLPLSFGLSFPEKGETYFIEVKNGVLHYSPASIEPEAATSFSLSRAEFLSLLLGKETIGEAAAQGKVQVKGDQKVFGQFLSLLDEFPFWFNIVTPPGNPVE